MLLSCEKRFQRAQIGPFFFEQATTATLPSSTQWPPFPFMWGFPQFLTAQNDDPWTAMWRRCRHRDDGSFAKVRTPTSISCFANIVNISRLGAKIFPRQQAERRPCAFLFGSSPFPKHYDDSERGLHGCVGFSLFPLPSPALPASPTVPPPPSIITSVSFAIAALASVSPTVISVSSAPSAATVASVVPASRLSVSGPCLRLHRLTRHRRALSRRLRSVRLRRRTSSVSRHNRAPSPANRLRCPHRSIPAVCRRPRVAHCRLPSRHRTLRCRPLLRPSPPPPPRSHQQPQR
ncbi:hypothetical protein F5148DRAFT_894395 [Russula earlei]|uniref:Uncharacterized protein n=1 Tax=Russula earlei TaxID=71964 RepID=A0ACC0UA68_9AGAM|nr:hypothetical protein F5148DRAFT_894395 [Russula earlei]